MTRMASARGESSGQGEPGSLMAFQAFPTQPPLSSQLDLGLADLMDLTESRAPERRVYPYVVETVRRGEDGRFRQTGCSPNVHGGVITLCNCKHYMRAAEYFHDPKGVWVAGVTTAGLTNKHRRYLFYLMFARPVRSHAEMWRRLSPTVRRAKSATHDALGEVYEPKREDLGGEDAFDHRNYVPPVANHRHQNEEKDWQRDIDMRYGTRRPALLLGDSKLSFLWTRPRVWLVESSTPLPRNPHASADIAGFLSRLRDGGGDV